MLSCVSDHLCRPSVVVSLVISAHSPSRKPIDSQAYIQSSVKITDVVPWSNSSLLKDSAALQIPQEASLLVRGTLEVAKPIAELIHVRLQPSRRVMGNQLLV